VNVLPAIVTVAVRAAGSGFCGQETVTDPDPLPLVADTPNHVSLAVAVNVPVQPTGDPVIVTSWDPAVGPGLTEAGAIK
jgi:hypothetical protein